MLHEQFFPTRKPIKHFIIIEVQVTRKFNINIICAFSLLNIYTDITFINASTHQNQY